ncbi:outer dynein arm-docking complex subunit 4-like, partial [Homarus americanus]|uniref:outer dynein arm-docking complex subunit 4-like n=1 Tax=Homarus americanus TaxID=6706 RepID=UPI001C476D37
MPPEEVRHHSFLVIIFKYVWITTIRNPEDPDEGARTLKGKMVNRFVATELRQKRLMGHLGAPGREEIYCDKDRAAAVAMGDQDIKTSLKVKRKKERRLVQPEDTNSSVHLTEAQRAITMGRVETALSCAQKAVECGGDPASLVVRGRCHLLLGHLEEALEDAREALKRDASLVKAVLVQAEALYGMGEFERSLVLFHRGARKRPDLTSFTRGVHKAREAIINAIGGDKFPEAEEPLTGTSLSDGTGGSGQSQATSVPTICLTESKGSKSASKRLLGGLSKDKEFLASLVGRRSLRREVVTGVEASSQATYSGSQVAAVAKEALISLQHLESFMWQRDPGGGNTNLGAAGGGGGGGG